ncbi:tRNA-specific 2-thiouridylase MnmA [Oryza brachyantha]|uniref:tRNA-5-taurinomethyluridine 2-sulfurtransferase n=1 Tax=Oryza brachyantha TaxID=4533 RepID=J3LKI7_ORYBR|nr:tRNA-specific 2-thiouridylase MnmA [Oryza brachyantha]
MLLRVVSTLPALRPLLVRSSISLSRRSLLRSRLLPRPFRAISSSAPPPLASPSGARDLGDVDVGEDRLLRCVEAGRAPLRVAVLVSGGVDSSVALRLLHAAGHRCTAFYLKIWFQEDFRNFWSECPWDDDLKYVQAVCDKINVPLEVVHLSDEYWNHVVSHIINEYRSGHTPNPDVLCNTRIKFGAFLEAIENMGFDYIASGHYAHVVHPSLDNVEGPSVLQLSKDKVKDQTYFLSHLSQTQLRRLLFPLGCITKDEVRRLAAQMDLPNQDRKDSQGICFLGKVKFSEFVERHIGEMEGILLEAETGDYLGIHRGFWFYTIGQRQGLRLPGGPWYVVEKDVKNNVVFVSRNYYSLDKRRRTFRVGSLNWFSNSGPINNEQLKCKVRHSPEFHHCTVTQEQTSENRVILVVHLSEDDQGLAAGQFAAFYRDNLCLGSGIILDSWDEMNFPVCARALEIAKMEDKSRLGKPVKIMNLEHIGQSQQEPVEVA